MDASVGHLQEERDTLRDQLEDLKYAAQQLDELKDTVATLTDDNQRLQKQNNSYEYTNSQLSKQVDELTSTVESLHKDLQQDKIHIDQLRQDISQRDGSIATLREQVQQQQSLLQQRDQAVQETQRQLDSALQSHQQACADYENKLQAKRVESFTLQSEVKTAQESVGSLTARAQQLEAMNAELQQELARVVQRANGMMASVQSIVAASQHTTPVKTRPAEWTGEEKSEVESVLQSLQEWCQGIQRENQSLREEAARGRREASEAGEASKAALSDLREQVRGSEALLASKDRELSSLRDELASVKAQLQETLAAQSAAALSSRDATAQLQAQLATVQAEAGKRYRELGEEYNALVDQCQKLQQAQQKSAGRLQEAQEAATTHRQQAAEQAAELQRAQETLRSTTEELQRLQRSELQCAQLRQHNEEVAADLQAAQVRVEALEAQLAGLQTDVGQLTQEREALAGRVAESQRQDALSSQAQAELARQLEAKDAQLREASAQGQQSVERLQTQLAAKQQELATARQQATAMQQQAAAAQQQATALQQELATTRQQAAAMQQQATTLQQELATARTGQEEALSQLRGTQEELKRQRAMLAQQQGDSQLVQHLQAVVGQREARLGELQHQLEEKAATTQALQAEVERLRREVEAKAQSLQGVRTRVHQLMGDAKERSVSLYSGCVVWGLGVGDSLAEWTGEEKSEVEGVLQSLQEWCQGIQRENQSLREEAARGRREASEAGEASKAALSDLREQVRGGEAILASKDRELSSLRDELASVKAQLQETLAAQSAQQQALEQELKDAQAQLSAAQQQRLEQSFQQAAPEGLSLRELVSLQAQLSAAQKELAEKRVRVSTLEAQLAACNQRLQEAAATLKALEASYDELRGRDTSATQAKELAMARQEAAALRAEKERLQQQVSQYSSMYNTASAQLGAKIAEVEQVRQLGALKEQEFARVNAYLQSSSADAALRQLTESARVKDQRIAQLESENQRLTFSLAQAKRDSEVAVAQVQQQLADLQVQLAARQQDATTIAEARAQLAAKQQENARLQQQLLTEIGLVESLKASYTEIDRVLTERAGAGGGASSLQALLQAKEDHNKHLQALVSALETKNRELAAQLLAASAAPTAPTPAAPTNTAGTNAVTERLAAERLAALERVAAALGPCFPEAAVTAENASEYAAQLSARLSDEKGLYAGACREARRLQQEKAELVKKVAALQNYAAGHDHIDKRADAFVEDVIRTRNDFEQKYLNAAQEAEEKKVKVAELQRALEAEKKRVIRLLAEKKEGVPPELASLLEECVNICLLAKLDKSQKLKTVPEIVSTLKDVRRGLTGTLNLLKRENERLSYENKRIKELAAKDRKKEEKINAKIRQIILIVQNQGKALKDFVLAFQAIQKK